MGHVIKIPQWDAGYWTYSRTTAGETKSDGCGHYEAGSGYVVGDVTR